MKNYTKKKTQGKRKERERKRGRKGRCNSATPASEERTLVYHAMSYGLD